MNLDYFARLKQRSSSRMVKWLQEHELLAHPLLCDACNQEMDLVQRETSHIDGFQWLVFV